jgi:hypothetical protein
MPDPLATPGGMTIRELTTGEDERGFISDAGAVRVIFRRNKE